MTDYNDPDMPPPPGMMCETCQHVLTLTVTFEDLVTLGSEEPVGQLQVPVWNHPGGLDFDHDPVPVPTDPAVIAEICDFCSAPNVAGVALATPFTVRWRTTEHRDNGEWTCCVECRGFLEKNQGNRLIARAVERLTGKHGPEAGGAVDVLHRAFLQHFTGEIADPERHTNHG